MGGAAILECTYLMVVTFSNLCNITVRPNCSNKLRKDLNCIILCLIYEPINLKGVWHIKTLSNF